MQMIELGVKLAKLAALGIAVALTVILIYGFQFQWFAGLAIGALGYFVAKYTVGYVIATAYAYAAGRRAGRWLASLPPDIREDIVDCAPPDVKERLTKKMKNIDGTNEL
jgi:hypothetical protein